MEKLFLFLSLILLISACTDKKENPAPENNQPPKAIQIEFQLIRGAWQVVETERKSINTQNQQSVIKKNYSVGDLTISLAQEDKLYETSKTTLLSEGRYSLRPSGKQPNLIFDVYTTKPESWTHDGIYYVDSLAANRLVMT